MKEYEIEISIDKIFSPKNVSITGGTVTNTNTDDMKMDIITTGALTANVAKSTVFTLPNCNLISVVDVSNGIKPVQPKEVFINYSTSSVVVEVSSNIAAPGLVITVIGTKK